MKNFRFESLEAFLDATLVDHGRSNEFFGNVNLQQAKNFAINGWSEGREHISKFQGKMENVAAKSILKQELVYDVTGLDFDIGLVVEGQPECWYDFSPKEEQRIVRILYGIGVSAALSEAQMHLRGAAICSLIDLLESNGIRVELDVFFDFDYGNDGRGEIITIVNVKQASQPLDVDRIGFVLMHAGMARKLALSFCETIFGFYRGESGFARTSPDEKDYQLVIRRGFTGFPEYANVDSMLTWVKSKLKEFGVNMSGGND